MMQLHEINTNIYEINLKKFCSSVLTIITNLGTILILSNYYHKNWVVLNDDVILAKNL